MVLREGCYYLENTIKFTSIDSNFLISNYKNEKVEISGAIPIDCKWEFYKNGMSCYLVCKLYLLYYILLEV